VSVRWRIIVSHESTMGRYSVIVGKASRFHPFLYLFVVILNPNFGAA